MARIPVLRHHRAKELGYARFDGRMVYFGRWPKRQKHPPPEVEAAFRDYLRDWLARHPEARPPAVPTKQLSVDRLWVLYHARCLTYYRKRGKVTSEVGCVVTACRVAARLFGDLPAVRFTARHLIDVRDEMTRLGWVRQSVNAQVSRVRGMFKWASKVEQGYIPRAVYLQLCEVEPLLAGRTESPEGEGVGPVEWATVERTLPVLRPVVASLVRVHYLLGCRSQDIVGMRPCDLDRTADPLGGAWLFKPAASKVEHHRRRKRQPPLTYWVGPQAQEILMPLLGGCPTPESYVFPVGAGKNAKRKRSDSAGCYTTNSYRYHVTRRCKKHGLPHWFPLQLRHARLTEIRSRYGADTAQAVAQHEHISTTEIYARADADKARRVMAEIG